MRRIARQWPLVLVASRHVVVLQKLLLVAQRRSQISRQLAVKRILPPAVPTKKPAPRQTRIQQLPLAARRKPVRKHVVKNAADQHHHPAAPNKTASALIQTARALRKPIPAQIKQIPVLKKPIPAAKNLRQILPLIVPKRSKLHSGT